MSWPQPVSYLQLVVCACVMAVAHTSGVSMLGIGLQAGGFAAAGFGPLRPGTRIRIREEERLLRAQFGDEHAAYVREVAAFIPRIL